MTTVAAGAKSTQKHYTVVTHGTGVISLNKFISCGSRAEHLTLSQHFIVRTFVVNFRGCNRLFLNQITQVANNPFHDFGISKQLHIMPEKKVRKQ